MTEQRFNHKIPRRTFLKVCAAAAAAGLTACSKTQAAAALPELTVGSDNYPPFIYLNNDSTPTGIETLADLAGKTMMVQSTTKPEEIFLAGTDPRIPQFGELLSAEDRSVQYAMLNCGYVDAIAAHEAAILRYMQDCNANFRILEEPLLVTGIGVAFALNDTRGLDEKLTETFAAMRADGTMKQIVGKYLPDPEKYLEVDALEP